MKYYIVVTPFFPTTDCFRGPFVYDQVKALMRQNKYNIVVFRPVISLKNKIDYVYQGVNVYSFYRYQLPSGAFDFLLNEWNDRFFYKKIEELGISIYDVSYIHCHTGSIGHYGLSIKKKNPNIKVMLQHHDLDPFGVHIGKMTSFKWHVVLRTKWLLEIFNSVDLHICVSRWVRDSLYSFPKVRTGEVYEPFIKKMEYVKKLGCVNNKKYYILYNGVDLNIFYRQNELYIKKSEFIIGCVANFVDLKQHITLLKALEILVNEYHMKDIRLVFVGSGPTQNMCEEYILEHNLKDYVLIKKEVDHKCLRAFYNSLDLFVLPSVFEGFGCVYMESYASGVPFIGVCNQGASEYILPNEEYKWLIKPYDYFKLSCLIRDYYSKRSIQKVSKKYNIDDLISSFIRFIDFGEEKI